MGETVVMDDLLKQGIAAFQNGKRAEARSLLVAFVRINPDSEPGWAWLFDTCDTEQERFDCLKQIVRINPQNEQASQLLISYTASKQPLEEPVTQPVARLSKQPVIEKPSDLHFKNEGLAQKIIRFLVIFQISSLLIGIILILVRLSSIAFFIAFLSLVLLLGALLWFYIHYQMIPLVQEKQKLTRQSKSLPAQILELGVNINLIQQNREKIKQDEQAELLAS